MPRRISKMFCSVHVFMLEILELRAENGPILMSCCASKKVPPDLAESVDLGAVAHRSKAR